MKKLLLGTFICGGLFLGMAVSAETVSGKVVNAGNNQLTVKTNDGQTMTMTTTDNTTYRHKKMHKKHKMKKGKNADQSWYFVPVAEEDDWIELTYDPKTQTANGYEVQDVIIYDD